MDTASDRPLLRQTVIDTPDPTGLAEFYRELLGYAYRPGDAPAPEHPTPEHPAPDWLVLVDDAGTPRLAFQLAPGLPEPGWPDGSPPQMLHLDLTVPDVAALERQRRRAVDLGARVLDDRSDDAEEPLFVLADPSGHPFCIFVVAPQRA